MAVSEPQRLRIKIDALVLGSSIAQDLLLNVAALRTKLEAHEGAARNAVALAEVKDCLLRLDRSIISTFTREDPAV